MARILIVDDEQAIVDTLTRVLEKDGHAVTAVTNPMRVIDMDLARFNLIITDVMMPDLDGFELVRQIRAHVDSPILFLTAKGEEGDAVVGYGMGADDYIRKPCGAAELRAKVSAHLRREERERHSSLEFGRLRIDLVSKRITVDDILVHFTPTEYEICEHMARHRGQIFSKESLLEHVAGWDSIASVETITAHVGNIRTKFKRFDINPIATSWGMGYRWELKKGNE